MDPPEAWEDREQEEALEERTSVFSFDGDLPDEVDDRVHYLVVVNGTEEGKRYEIGPAPITIGRHRQNAICLADDRVSGAHCRVQVIGEAFLVTDLNSTNGTFVEGNRLCPAGLAPIESYLRVGGHVLKHEYRRRRDVEQDALVSVDLQKAAEYVRALLPSRRRGGPLQVEWSFVPSLTLGGDAFGYHALSDRQWAIYLLDVCGHGVAAAMHSVSAVNVIRHQTLPGVDFSRPDEVLRSLNRVFQMEEHGNMYFTLWYGVYDHLRRELTYASAGHPPAVLVTEGDATVRPLTTRALAVGMFPDTDYPARQLTVPPGSTLYVYSDGAFEVTTAQGRHWTLGELQALLLQGAGYGPGEADRILQQIFRLAGREALEDDFSLMVCTFPSERDSGGVTSSPPPGTQGRGAF